MNRSVCAKAKDSRHVGVRLVASNNHDAFSATNRAWVAFSIPLYCLDCSKKSDLGLLRVLYSTASKSHNPVLTINVPPRP